MVVSALAVAGDVSAGAAHVKANHRYPGLLVIGCDGIADNAASGSRQDSLESGEPVDVNQSAIALHKLAAGTPVALLLGHARATEATPEALLEAGDVLLDSRRKVGIGAYRSGARDQLDHGHQLMAERNVLEPNLPRNLANQGFMVGKRICVHE